jgi:hypothetical protein
MPSGKQILLRVLSELSQGAPAPSSSPEISDRIRAAFLLHGSTASESWPAVQHIQWDTEHNADGVPIRRGITSDGIYLTDLFESLEIRDGIPSHLASKYPGLSPDGYREALRVIWLILSSVQWFGELVSVEDEADSRVRGETLLADYIQKLHHFRKHPEDFR